jgi:transglutaminase-like putative cysteine protease
MRAGVMGRTVIWMRPLWLSLLLVGAILIIAMGSVNTARWVSDSGPMLQLLWYGAVFGILLSVSRWRGRRVLLYSLLVSLMFSLQALGRVSPSLWTWITQPFSETVWNMHLRALALGERIAGWFYTLQAGENITDTGLFVLLFGFLLWNAMAWLVWCVLRRRRPLEGLLPFGFLLGVNVYLSGQDLNGMWVFILAGLLLMVHGGYRAVRHDWEARQVDYPDDAAEWIGITLIVLVMLGLFIRLSPTIGSREGWQSIADAIERYRARAAETSERLFSEVRPSVLEAPALNAILPDLSIIGGPIPNADQTVLWVKVSDPAPPPPEVGIQVPGPPQHYWRSRIDGEYTGAGWVPTPLQQEVRPVNLSEDSPPGRYLLDQEFEITVGHEGALFAVNQPAASGTGTSLLAARADGSTLVVGEVNRYEVTSLATRVTATELRRAGTGYPPAIADAYLQLPPELPERVSSMAARIAGQHDNPYQKAAALQDYLRTNYIYNEGVAPPPAGRDAVDYFLYESQEGFCTYYASAMVVMLRAEGVPARVASGFATGTYDYERGAYRVAARNAHAWVEVYFPGYGWIEFEPTSALPPRIYPEGLEELAYVPIEPVITPEPVEEPPGVGGIIQLIGVILGLLLLAFVLRNWERWQNQRATGPRTRATLLYWQMRRWLARAGLDMPASITPAEFLDLSADTLAARGRLWTALHQATELYQQAEYSRREPTILAVLSTHQAWQRAAPQWLLLWAAARWKRLTTRKASMP